ncbi:MAG TPA: GDSL-type esterase/lipase family protein [Candidatus Acidoferrales bacterium]|nr:GDSL-type esterase/lipase family protein [Candidatus Acidoferrales bacterium]
MHTTRTKAIVAISLILTISIATFLVYTNITLFHNNAPVYSSANLSKIACVGDSITQITSYVNTLQTLVGNSSVVGNFGVSGATVTLASVEPYLFRNESDAAKEFQPTTVVILLGTNDARSDVFVYIDKFLEDYKIVISKYQMLETKPQIYLVLPPPVYENNINISSSDLSEVIIPMIKQAANDTGLPLIDAFTPLLNHPEYFVDGVHPNDEGARVIAEAIYQQIT